MMPWYFGVVESRHELQNPTSPEKIRLLGERLQLGPESRVLDVGSGRGGPAILLARTFGCRITCIEKAEGFDAAARERARDADVDTLLEFVHADAGRRCGSPRTAPSWRRVCPFGAGSAKRPILTSLARSGRFEGSYTDMTEPIVVSDAALDELAASRTFEAFYQAAAAQLS